MSTWMHNHPVLSSIVAWAILVLLIASPFLIRAWRRSTGEEPEQSGITDDPLDLVDCPRCGGSGFTGQGTGYGDVCDWCGGQQQMPREIAYPEPLLLTPDMEVQKRVPMLSRFVPDSAHGLSHDLAMVDQILGDQAKAGDTIPAGDPTDAPAPGEPGYHRPSERIRVIVGPYTIVLDRAAPTSVSEERPNGAHWPLAEVPGEWEPVVIALAMEVLRQRERWPEPSATVLWPEDAAFAYGEFVTTPRAPFWRGTVCGWYRNSEGRLGFNVEAEAIPLAIHNYPQSGLRR